MANIIEGNLRADGKKFAIIIARFNSFISEKLLEGALDSLIRSGALDADIDVVRVPGALPLALTGLGVLTALRLRRNRRPS